VRSSWPRTTALQLTAEVNLCECLKTWAAENRPMEEIGLAALDKALTQRPDWAAMLKLRFWHYFKHGRYQEALLVSDTLLAKEPDDAAVLTDRVIVLRSMGQVAQALALVPAMLKALDNEATGSVAAAVHFAHGDDAEAARLARNALVRMTRAQRAVSEPGSVALVLVAAESRAGHLERARAAFKDFQDVVPKAQTVGQIKAWLQPSWMAPGGDAFWDALKRAGAGG
jgi:tetratricopeptide (TPR) repeat protein